MKRIILIRHAKSSRDSLTEDMKRPLSYRGFVDAALVAQALNPKIEKLDAIYCSPAKRTRETCRIILEGLACEKPKVSYKEELYDFGGSSVLSFIKGLSFQIETAMIFGHNYALTDLVNRLGSEPIDNFPTAAVTSIIFDVKNFSDIVRGKTEFLLTPKSLKKTI